MLTFLLFLHTGSHLGACLLIQQIGVVLFMDLIFPEDRGQLLLRHRCQFQTTLSSIDFCSQSRLLLG